MLNNLLIQRGFRRTLPQPRTRCGRAFPADRGFANRLTLFLGIGLSSLLWPGISLGQGADRTPLNLVRLEISPAELPTPALKYKLTRSFEETVDGDAAPIYYRAFLRLGLLGYSREDWANLARWNAITPENIPADLLAGQLKQAKDVFREADLASRQSDCHWPLERQTLDPAAFADAQLPELELARRLAILIALRSRLAIFDGRIDDCLDGLKTGFELATDVGQGQTLIHAIVGNSIAMQMYQVVLQLVGQPNAPNMYWAVTQLPEPFIPLRPAIETEMHSLFGALPLLANPESAVHTPAEWRALTIQTLSHARTLQGKDVFNESRAEQDVPARLEMSPEEEFGRRDVSLDEGPPGRIL